MKNIAAKLVKIMQECSYVQKKGVNKFHNYKYASAADVLEKVSESCTKHGVATFANAEILEWRQHEKNHYATVKVCITAIDQDSGESVTFSGVGCGQDVGDKAVMKAETAASKYAWMMSLNIATGDDPEADETTDKINSNIPVASQDALQATKDDSATTSTPKCKKCGRGITKHLYDNGQMCVSCSKSQVA
jgi:hypothetical protein